MDIILITAAVYAALNILSFLIFANDKRKAKRNLWRTSENTLLLSALFGPFGALFAMKTAHHKTQKRKFLLVYIFILLHLVMFWLILTGKI
ncbi:MAG: DUF1294 domain-containing protein [Methanomicrobium sp.]|nr:DUF1294 domain-containing protein [Methanomicrobium sp.]